MDTRVVRATERLLHVGPYENNAYLLHDPDTDDALLVDAANEAERLLDLLEGVPLVGIVTTHRHPDHIQALAGVLKAHDVWNGAHPADADAIADQVGVHVTTVSRAVDDKWVQTPRGIFPLKRFFGGGTQTLSGEEVAWETIKQKLLEIIEKEDKANPLSDEDLVSKLQEAGYPVARRTVTKYRKMANIPSSRQRKEWTA